MDTTHVTDIVWERLKPFIPDLFPRTDKYAGEEPVGLNERLRFLRYDPGDFFKGHSDGAFWREATDKRPSQCSKVTLQLYLNEGFEGGATTFLGEPDCPCVPKIGMALVFVHELYHEGSLLKAGRKYAVRTDIMYQDRQEN